MRLVSPGRPGASRVAARGRATRSIRRDQAIPSWPRGSDRMQRAQSRHRTALLRLQPEELPRREAGEEVGDFREARFVE